MIKKAIRLEDIARKLHVTKVTVSKALRNHPDISQEMTEKVKRSVVKMGYYPNRHASNLSSKKSRTIGVVVPKIAHYFFSSVIESIYDAAHEKNYEVILMVSQEDEEREKKHLESLISMRVDGIMISIAQNTKDYTIFETIKKRNIPLVFFDRIINGMGFSTVSVNDRCGSFDLINYAIRAGYLKIAHLSGPLNINIGYERLKGYEEALKYNGIQINKKWIIECGFSEKNGYDGFMKLFNLGELPELIYAVTFPVALGILNAAKDVKVKIPEEINVVCFGRTDFNHVVTPKISCVVQPTRDLGIKSIELLLSEIEHPTVTDRKKIILDTELEIYDTFIPPKADKKVV